MRANQTTIILILLCVGMVFPVSGLVPDDNQITSSKLWLVANGYDTATVTIGVYNESTGNPLNTTLIQFSVNNTIYGSFSPNDVYTMGGTAQSTFTAGLKSGTVTVFTKIFYRENDSDPAEPLKNKTESFELYIDHDTPYQIPTGGVILPLNGEATVGTIVLVGIQMKDSHGNPIDNRKEIWYGQEAEKVRFWVTGSPSGTAYYSPEGITNVTRQVNGTGWAVADFRLDLMPGQNILKFEPLTSVPDAKRTIYGVADGIPFYIYSEVFPGEYVLADGESNFFILYRVEDEFHNGLQLKDIAVNSSLSENYLFTTNSTGQVGISYGPKSEIGDVTLTATALQNTSVTVSNEVRFVNLTANEMIFTATPQSMASYDAKPDVSTLYGYVIDSEGNPVVGESVKFSIVNVWYDATYNVTEQPSLQNGTASGVNVVWGTTNEQGYAEVYLKPCSFTYDEFADGYVSSATGHCTIEADWITPNSTHVIRPLTFTFKNYPYLSAETMVSSSRVNVTGTVDVTLWLKGDGFMLLPKPIDAMLVLDQSLSMDYNDMEDGMKRITAMKIAAVNFVDQMNSTTDRLGLIPYSTGISSRDENLGTPFSTIKYQINKLNPVMYTASRLALKTAIERMNNYPNPDDRTIRAIIFMTDGEFNYYEDPLARGTGYQYTYNWGYNTYIDRHTWFNGLGGYTGDPPDRNIGTNQNMSNYARNRSLRLYTISFSDDIVPGSDTWKVMDNLAESTGATHFHASTAAQLNDVYTQIAGELKTKAGVNTTSMCDFQNVQVKNVTMPGAEVFEYQYVYGLSTLISRWTGSESPTLTMRNDTLAWQQNHTLDFDVGTIEVNDNWMATFRLKVLTDGDIHVFGPNSLITFDDGTKTLHIPDTVITAIPNMVNESFSSGEFTEENVTVTQITDTIFEWTWTRTYTGEYPLQEYYYISLDGGYQWTLVGERTLPPEVAHTETTGFFRYDIQNLIPHGADLEGIVVDFKLKAYAMDAPSPRSPRGPPIPLSASSNKSYITLQ